MVNTGAMIACYPPKGLADRLALPGYEAPKELHVTLAFLGTAADLTLAQAETARSIVENLVALQSPMEARIGGLGRFNAPDGDPEALIAHVDCPDLHPFQDLLRKSLIATSVPCAVDHGFTPHITLAYLAPGVPAPIEQVPPITFMLRSISLVLGESTETFILRGRERNLSSIAGEKSMNQLSLVERYHDAFTDALKESLRGRVTDEEWVSIVSYARAKAGGIASAAAKKTKQQEDAESGILKLVGGHELSLSAGITDEELVGMHTHLKDAILEAVN